MHRVKSGLDVSPSRTVDFQVSALDIDRFRQLFGLDRETLAKAGVKRLVADSRPGFPCRVSLQDAEVGENVLLMNYEHQSRPTPFQSSHAIFVREWADQATPNRNEIPEMFRHRLLSVRAFDASGMMTDADIIEGMRLETLIVRMLKHGSVECLHLHNAKPGCYAAMVTRA